MFNSANSKCTKLRVICITEDFKAEYLDQKFSSKNLVDRKYIIVT